MDGKTSRIVLPITFFGVNPGFSEDGAGFMDALRQIPGFYGKILKE